jgi:hypothetical protein
MRPYVEVRMEGETRVVIESMEETGSLYTPGSGALAGMLAEHETPAVA